MVHNKRKINSVINYKGNENLIFRKQKDCELNIASIEWWRMIEIYGEDFRTRSNFSAQMKQRDYIGLLCIGIYRSPRRHAHRSKIFKTNWKKLKYIFMIILTYFSKHLKDRDVKFWHNLYSSFQFVLSKFGINIFNSL